MLDETLISSRPSNWEDVAVLAAELVSLIGSPSFHHEIVEPVSCLTNVANKLRGKRFSCIFDLTGWLSLAAKELFPDTQIVEEFSLSRIRQVSSPKLETTGYLLSMSIPEINQARQSLDLTRPLVIDDVSFSGRTGLATMRLWGLGPEKTTHAFLIANTGNFGERNEGAVGLLTGLGSEVVSGFDIKTPKDDGWHLKDLHQNPNLEQAFVLAIAYQEIIKQKGKESEAANNFFSLETVKQVLFPDQLTSEGIIRLSQEGRFLLLSHQLTNNQEIHAKNPFLWASPYFHEHIDIDRVLENQCRITGILSNLHRLTSNPEGKREAVRELQAEVRDKIPGPLEGQLFINSERMR